MSKTLRSIRYSSEAWKLLQGVFCVYKPSGLTMPAVKNRVIGNICRDLNEMENLPPEKYVTIEDDPTSETGLTVKNVSSLIDCRLTVGPGYVNKDFHFKWASDHGIYTSGLCVVGVNCQGMTTKLKYARYLKAYHVCGRFGIATEDFHEDGKIIEKSTFRHIKQFRLDSVLASLQAAHQQHMFRYMGIDIKSQTAYDLASQGPIRPSHDSPPILYGIRCIDFQLPEFTIEIQCINENEYYLMKLINDIGLTLKSNAVCTKIRQIKFGHFDLQHALLRKHWTLENILNNITVCKEIIAGQIYPDVPILKISRDEDMKL